MVPPEAPSPEEWEAREELRASLVRTQRQLAKAKAKSEQMVEAAMASARDAILAQPRLTLKSAAKDRRKRKDEVALWHLTDLQYGKRTETFDGSALSYNRQRCAERVDQFVDKCIAITNIQRADHPVKNAVIMFGGDMVEGVCFQFPTQVHEIDGTIHEQWAGVSKILSKAVLRALEVYEHVTVIPEWGNHGRVGSRRDAVPRYDNFDRMAYYMSRVETVANGGDPKRLTWDDSAEDIQRVEIGNYRALLMHGDEVGRGGFASPMQITNHVNRWRSGAYPWKFQDCYVGHFHNHMELSLADGTGAVYWTGSVESDNRYARETMAASARPSQRLHFIDPEAGLVTAQYKIWLD